MLFQNPWSLLNFHEFWIAKPVATRKPKRIFLNIFARDQCMTLRLRNSDSS